MASCSVPAAPSSRLVQTGFVADLARVLPEAFSLRRSYWLISHTEAAETARIRAVRRFIKAQAEAARTLFLGSPPPLTR